MPLHAHEIDFLHFAARKLRLNLAGHIASARYDERSGRIGIETMRGPQLLRVIERIEHVLERVAMKAPPGMHRQRRRLIDDDQRLVLVQHLYAHVHVGLDERREFVKVPLARTNDPVGLHGLVLRVDEKPLRAALRPVGARNVRDDGAQRVEQRLAIVLGRNRDGPEMIARQASRQRTNDVVQTLVATRDICSAEIL
jgi:hypothetical protein